MFKQAYILDFQEISDPDVIHILREFATHCEMSQDSYSLITYDYIDQLLLSEEEFLYGRYELLKWMNKSKIKEFYLHY